MSEQIPYQAPRSAADLAAELRATTVRLAEIAREILENTGASPHLDSAVDSARATVRHVHAHLDKAHADIAALAPGA